MLFNLLLASCFFETLLIHTEVKDSLESLPAGKGNKSAHQDVWFDTRETVKEKSNLQMNGELCPDLWFVWEEGECRCGSDVAGAVQCNPVTKEVSVLNCYCITLYSVGERSVYVVGDCLFNCVNVSRGHTDFIYHRAPSNCGSLNRKGTLCGQCIEGYAPPAYSYDLKCMKCGSDQHKWWLYATFAFLPLTVFIVIILVFRISVVSPKLQVFVFAAQNIVSPINLRIVVLRTKTMTPLSKTLTFILTAAYGIWNLDFFRVVLPNVCLNITPLQVLALDYLVAIYPMLLMAVAYAVVELHACGFRPVLYMWRPLHRHFVQFRRHWGVQASIMDTFATFFVLSTTKLFSVSFDLLIPTKLHTAREESLGLRLYYDPSIKYFHIRHHLPYALLAVTVLAVFIFLPVFVLLFYQRSGFRSCLVRLRLGGRVLDEFVHCFQQYYKDGSNGTRDCRWFAGFYIIIRAALFLTYAFSLSGISYIFLAIILTITAIIVLMVRPYREEYSVYNAVDTNFILWQAIFGMSLGFQDLAGTQRQYFFKKTFLGGTFILSALPIVYVTGLVVYQFFKNQRALAPYSDHEESQNTITSSLPDRLSHPNQYQDSFGFIGAANRPTTSTSSD